MVKLKSRGNFNRTYGYLNRTSSHLNELNMLTTLEYYGVKGCEALAKATPTSTGKTASSWVSNVKPLGRNKYSLEWHNMNMDNGENVALLIELGYTTKNGYHVSARKYIDPALQPVVDELTRKIEEGVKKA